MSFTGRGSTLCSRSTTARKRPLNRFYQAARLNAILPSFTSKSLPALTRDSLAQRRRTACRVRAFTGFVMLSASSIFGGVVVSCRSGWRMGLLHCGEPRPRNGRPLLGSSGANCCNLIRLSANLFSGTLSRQSLLQSALLTRLQVVGVTLHFLNDVFRLNLALEPTEGIL